MYMCGYCWRRKWLVNTSEEILGSLDLNGSDMKGMEKGFLIACTRAMVLGFS